jgi:pimeloyl-ACP methyl ester carboxylesterase
MVAFKDIPDERIRSIKAPTLVLNGDNDVVRPEHALELSRTLPQARLAILPSGHGDYIGEICSPDKSSELPALVVRMIETFLKD